MLKLNSIPDLTNDVMQPPSGGCVLKQAKAEEVTSIKQAATFGWLCVETANHANASLGIKAATFGWLCVETTQSIFNNNIEQAATFGWLCVETGF